LESIHNKGLRIALENLTERSRRKLTKLAPHIAENENHPVTKLLRDQEVYDEDALRRKLSKPVFIRAQEAGVCERTWINNNFDNMIT
jgi:hypothetical protein